MEQGVTVFFQLSKKSSVAVYKDICLDCRIITFDEEELKRYPLRPEDKINL